MFLIVFSSSVLGFSFIFERKYFLKNNKSLLYFLKSIQKHYLEDNLCDFYSILNFINYVNHKEGEI